MAEVICKPITHNTQPVLHSKKFFDLLRVGCCFHHCLSSSRFFLISLPAAPLILLLYYTQTHYYFCRAVGRQLPCPQVVLCT